MLIRISLFLLLMMWSGSAWATSQIPDILVDQGKEHALKTTPMEAYFNQYPERRPRSDVRSTALGRGYLAFFEIRGDALVLKDIKVQAVDHSKPSRYATHWVSVLQTVIPDGQTLTIHWFTGLLVLPKGAIRNYADLGYGSRYTHYRILEVQEGRVRAERNLSGQEYDAFREKQFQAYRKTEAYIAERKRLEANGRSQEFIDSFMKSTVMESTSKFLVPMPQK